MKKIGLFFGSFNPMHIGHLILANHFAENTDLNEVWIVVSPQNPLKPRATLLADHHRYAMVQAACENYPNIKPSNIEFSLPKPSYTIDTMVYLEEKYPNYQFVLLMGEDSFCSLPKWKNYKLLLERYSMYVYPRNSHEIPKFDFNAPLVKWINAPLIEISATLIRKMIREKKNVRPLLPPEVFDYLDGSSLYASVHSE